MKYLLDTHILIWCLSDQSDLLPKEIVEIIDDPKNEIFYSAASVWEVTIKYSIKPDQIGVSPENLVKLCDKAGLKSLPIINEHAIAVKTLKRSDDAPRHKDPFDRLLIAQAKSEGMILITQDPLLDGYHERCILTIRLSTGNDDNQ